MKIAVTYEQGRVFQHFGHTEQFKLYEVEDGKLRSSELMASAGSGHGALAALLADAGVDVLICGGIGGGAQAALAERGIELCAGASGDADEAVAAYLRGELINTGANCEHHEHHGEGSPCGEQGCGGHEEGGCGGCSGCREAPTFEGKNVGKRVRAHYRGTFNDGTQFDSSYERGEPLEFICGAGMMIPGFDRAVADMEPGETKQIRLLPEEAYGETNPELIFPFEIAQLPGAETLSVGDRVYLQSPDGQAFPVKVLEKTDTVITLDANHEMAGKELNFTIELTEVL